MVDEVKKYPKVTLPILQAEGWLSALWNYCANLRTSFSLLCRQVIFLLS